MPAFSSVLVANRGEIAVRVMQTLRRLDITAVAVYSDADAGARHTIEADAAVRIGPADASRSYLSIDAIINAALSARVQAVHPGYGFLAENAGFARACAQAGLVFIGPPPEAIEMMGDKIRAKQLAEAAGVAVVPGVHRSGLSDDDLFEAASTIGFPVLLKPSAGGGGKGMHRVGDANALRGSIEVARREAISAFGDDTLFVERFIEVPRHVEIQILADSHGSTIHLGERECTLQRRHQKIIEETPSPLIDAAMREAMGASAVRVAHACGYTGAGTVEFIVPGNGPESFFFMEMNTRLQVEHPVTELVTGIDLVEAQIHIAAGDRLNWRQDEIAGRGHAVEARIYAEDPGRGFLPTGGRIVAMSEPSMPHVRTDSGISTGTEVSSNYDPLLAKVIAWASTRDEALDRLDAALRETAILGVTTNVAFLRALVADPDVRAGSLDTGLIERHLDRLVVQQPADVAALVAVLGLLAERGASRSQDPFDTLVGWRIGDPEWTSREWETPDRSVLSVSSRGDATAAELRIGEGPIATGSARLADGQLTVVLDDVRTTWAYAREGGTTWLGHEGATWSLRARQRTARPTGPAGPRDGRLLSPMPGTVTALHVAVGDAVNAGQPIVSVEAMKMEHLVRAGSAGVVVELPVRVGQAVAVEALLAVVGRSDTEASDDLP